MKKLSFLVFTVTAMLACGKNEAIQDDPDTAGHNFTSRAEGDVFRSSILANGDDDFRVETIAVDRSGNLGGFYKETTYLYDVASSVASKSNQPIAFKGINADRSGNWILVGNYSIPYKLLKYAPDFSSYADYSSALPEGRHLLAACGYGGSIAIATTDENAMYSRDYISVSIYTISSRRVLTHIVDIPAVYSQLPYSYGRDQLLKAAGAYVYFCNNDDPIFRINLATAEVDSFIPRFDPLCVTVAADRDYLYGLDDRWIVEMRFDQAEDYEVGEIPYGVNGDILSASADAGEFYLAGGAHLYKLHGVR